MLPHYTPFEPREPPPAALFERVDLPRKRERGHSFLLGQTCSSSCWTFHVKRRSGKTKTAGPVVPAARASTARAAPAQGSQAPELTVAALASDKAAALALAPVSRETETRLDRYMALLLEWQAKTNLVAPSTIPHLWTRHIADSLQLIALAPAAKRWADLGSGGGFPGIVLACVLADSPGAQVHLVERNAKKAAFLREALRVTAAPGLVHLAEIGDNVDRITGPVDCVTARALAPLHQLIGFARPLVRNGAKALFLKGQDVEAELTEAAKYWNIQPQLHRSRTGDGWIVELDAIERRG